MAGSVYADASTTTLGLQGDWTANGITSITELTPKQLPFATLAPAVAEPLSTIGTQKLADTTTLGLQGDWTANGITSITELTPKQLLPVASLAPTVAEPLITIGTSRPADTTDLQGDWRAPFTTVTELKPHQLLPVATCPLAPAVAELPITISTQTPANTTTVELHGDWTANGITSVTELKEKSLLAVATLPPLPSVVELPITISTPGRADTTRFDSYGDWTAPLTTVTEPLQPLAISTLKPSNILDALKPSNIHHATLSTLGGSITLPMSKSVDAKVSTLGSTVIQIGSLQMPSDAFDPVMSALGSQILRSLGCSPNASIQKIMEFGGMNCGVFRVTDCMTKFVLKLVSCQRSHASLPTDAQKCVEIAQQFPRIVNDPMMSFPFKIFECFGPGGTHCYDLLVMREAPGKLFSEMIAEKVNTGQPDQIKDVFRRVGGFLAKFHASYGMQHGDFNPSNVFYDEATGCVTAIDVAGMGYAPYAAGIDDIAHFNKTIGSWHQSYGPQLMTACADSFAAGYREGPR